MVKKIRWNFEKALDIIVFQGGDDGRGYGGVELETQGLIWPCALGYQDLYSTRYVVRARNR